MASRKKGQARSKSAEGLVPAHEVWGEQRREGTFDVFNVRESVRYHAGLLLGMASKVLTPHLVAKPALAQVLDILPDVVRNDHQGRDARKKHGVRDVIAPDGRWAGWEILAGPDRVLVFPQSAACEDVAEVSDASVFDATTEQNLYTEAFRHWVRTYRPRQVYTGPFSRQGRRFHLLERIRTAFADNGVKFSCFEASDLIFSVASLGNNMWDLLARQAENEWLSILERNFAGKVYAAQNGRYPYGTRSLPLGYRRANDPKNRGRLSVDMGSYETVHLMLEKAADPPLDEEGQLSASALVAAWDEIGVPRMRWDARDLDRGPGVGSLKGDAIALVRRRLAWLDVYETGMLPVALNNPLPVGHTLAVHGVDLLIDPDDPDDAGTAFFDVEAGLPHGHATVLGEQVAVNAWASAATFRRIRELWPLNGCGRCEPCLSGEPGDCERGARGRSSGRSYALSGLPSWRQTTPDGEMEVRLGMRSSSNGRCDYTLRSRPVDQEGKPWDEFPGQPYATFTGAELENAVVQMIIADTSDAVVAGEHSMPVEEIVALRSELAELRAAAPQAEATARALEQEIGVRGDHSGALAAVANQKRHEAALANERIEAISQQLGTDVRIGEGLVEVDGSAAIVAREVADAAGGMVPIDIRRRLARLLDGTFRVEVVSPRKAIVSAVLRFPLVTRDGRPLPGAAHAARSYSLNHKTRVVGTGSNLSGRVAEALEMLMTTDLRVADVAELLDWDEGTTRNHLRAELLQVVATSGAMSALLDCPIPEPKQIVWAKHTGQPMPPFGEKYGDYVTTVLNTYFDPNLNWSMNWAYTSFELRRRVLSYMRAHFPQLPDGPLVRELREVFNLTTSQFQGLRGRYYLSTYPPVVIESGDWTPNRWWDRRRLSRIPCPHCLERDGAEFADHVLYVPEVAAGVLCPTCKRTPGSAVVFPDSYLRLWEGPHGRGGGRFSGTVEVSLPGIPDRPEGFRCMSD